MSWNVQTSSKGTSLQASKLCWSETLPTHPLTDPPTEVKCRATNVAKKVCKICYSASAKLLKKGWTFKIILSSSLSHFLDVYDGGEGYGRRGRGKWKRRGKWERWGSRGGGGRGCVGREESEWGRRGWGVLIEEEKSCPASSPTREKPLPPIALSQDRWKVTFCHQEIVLVDNFFTEIKAT